MGDLEVDYTTLEASHQTAETLQSQFEGLPDHVGKTSDIWGKSNISDSMHTFATNWGYHREVLSDKIKEVGEKIGSCIETFEKADKQVADGLKKKADK